MKKTYLDWIQCAIPFCSPVDGARLASRGSRDKEAESGRSIVYTRLVQDFKQCGLAALRAEPILLIHSSVACEVARKRGVKVHLLSSARTQWFAVVIRGVRAAIRNQASAISPSPNINPPSRRADLQSHSNRTSRSSLPTTPAYSSQARQACGATPFLDLREINLDR